jgi:hypothetical protein
MRYALIDAKRGYPLAPKSRSHARAHKWLAGCVLVFAVLLLAY